MTYFEYSIEMDKLDLKFDLSILEENIYQESVGSFFNKLANAITAYIDDCKKLHKLYKERKKLDKGMNCISRLCRYKGLSQQIIYVRGYNGKVAKPLSIEDEIQTVKNLIAYASLKINDKLISSYLENYELYKSGWDVFYKVKLKDIPGVYKTLSEKLDKVIDDLKITIKNLTAYFENASDQKKEVEHKAIFKSIIDKLKSTIKRDIDIMTMNFEVMQYEIGKKFSKLTENTANKVVKDVSDKDIMKNSNFVKEIKYGDDTYKVYETTYKDVSAFIYNGATIYVDNGFFELPKGYQLAILYHEIGHHQCKHFKPDNDFKSGKVNKGYDIPMVDVESMARRIRKDYNKFLNKILFSPYSNTDRYNNGEEFLYLLVEWEADRFAANLIGKNLISKALLSRFSDSMKSRMLSKDPQKQQDYYNYNMDRMKIRTKII